MTVPDAIYARLVDIARTGSPEAVRSLAALIARVDWTTWEAAQLLVLDRIPQPSVRDQVARLLESWRPHRDDLPPSALAVALRAAGESMRAVRSEQELELIWTGPAAPGVAFRRTDQALLEVINAARATLLIASFSVYITPPVESALNAALARNVALTFCLEIYEADGRRMGYDTIRALGSIGDRSQMYVWPREHRQLDQSGRSGLMHVKTVVADGRVLYLASANLTGAALNNNMELGVLVTGGSLPERVQVQFSQLIRIGVLRPYRDGV